MRIIKLLISLSALALSCKQGHSYSDYEKVKNLYGSKIVEIDTSAFGEITLTIELDSAISNEPKANKKIYSFNHAGNRTEEGWQGLYEGTSIPIGLWKKYDGNVLIETYYHNDKFGKDFIRKKVFRNGKLIADSTFNNYILYETEKKLMNINFSKRN